MKRNYLFSIVLLLSIGVSFTSCGDTWLKYDTSQKNKLYFPIDKSQVLTHFISSDVSFALLDESVTELPATVSVAMIGMAADYDREFSV